MLVERLSKSTASLIAEAKSSLFVAVRKLLTWVPTSVGNNSINLSHCSDCSHFLRVEMDRYQYPQVSHNIRLCRLCNSGAVEDEEHMVFQCTHAALVQVRQDYSNLFFDNSDSAVTTLTALLQQPQNQLSAFITTYFTAGDYETRNQHPTQAIRAARATARTAAAAAVPRRHSPRLIAVTDIT